MIGPYDTTASSVRISNTVFSSPSLTVNGPGWIIIGKPPVRYLLRELFARLRGK